MGNGSIVAATIYAADVSAVVSPLPRIWSGGLLFCRNHTQAPVKEGAPAVKGVTQEIAHVKAVAGEVEAHHVEAVENALTASMSPDGDNLDINFGDHPDSPAVFVINEVNTRPAANSAKPSHLPASGLLKMPLTPA